MRLLFDSEIIPEMRDAISNKQLNNWHWVFYKREDGDAEGISRFFNQHRSQFRRLYTQNANVMESIRTFNSDWLIDPEIVKIARPNKRKLLHDKVYFFGNNKELPKCTQWLCFIGSLNVKFTSEDGQMMLKPTSTIESMVLLSSREDGEMIMQITDLFNDLEQSSNSRGRIKIANLLTDKDVGAFINKHDKEIQGMCKHISHFNRNWDIFKMRYLLHRSYEQIGSSYSLSRERIRQIIIKMNKMLKTSKFNFTNN